MGVEEDSEEEEEHRLGTWGAVVKRRRMVTEEDSLCCSAAGFQGTGGGVAKLMSLLEVLAAEASKEEALQFGFVGFGIEDLAKQN